jgi:hypothetical protein
LAKASKALRTSSSLGWAMNSSNSLERVASLRLGHPGHNELPVLAAP